MPAVAFKECLSSMQTIGHHDYLLATKVQGGVQFSKLYFFATDITLSTASNLLQPITNQS